VLGQPPVRFVRLGLETVHIADVIESGDRCGSPIARHHHDPHGRVVGATQLVVELRIGRRQKDRGIAVPVGDFRVGQVVVRLCDIGLFVDDCLIYSDGIFPDRFVMYVAYVPLGLFPLVGRRDISILPGGRIAIPLRRSRSARTGGKENGNEHERGKYPTHASFRDQNTTEQPQPLWTARLPVSTSGTTRVSSSGTIGVSFAVSSGSIILSVGTSSVGISSVTTSSGSVSSGNSSSGRVSSGWASSGCGVSSEVAVRQSFSSHAPQLDRQIAVPLT